MKKNLRDHSVNETFDGHHVSYCQVESANFVSIWYLWYNIAHHLSVADMKHRSYIKLRKYTPYIDGLMP